MTIEEELTDEQIDWMIDTFIRPAIRDAIRQNQKMVQSWSEYGRSLATFLASLKP